MAKKDNPILKLLKVNEENLAREEAVVAQRRARHAEFRKKLCNLIKEADRTNIHISTGTVLDGYQMDLKVVNPGCAHIAEVDFRGKTYETGNIFIDDLILEDRAMKFIEEIVSALEKGTAKVTAGY